MENTNNKNYYIDQFMKLKNQIFDSLYGSASEELLYNNVPIKYVIEAKIDIIDSLIKAKKNKYSNGKIYKLECLTTGMCYIGSTIQPLNKRLHEHKSRSKNKRECLSYKIIDNNNYKISLIEAYPCNSKKELEAREYYHININECINKNKGFLSDSYERNKHKYKYKEYLEKNKKHINLKRREYYEANKQVINLKKRER